MKYPKEFEQYKIHELSPKFSIYKLPDLGYALMETNLENGEQFIHVDQGQTEALFCDTLVKKVKELNVKPDANVCMAGGGMAIFPEALHKADVGYPWGKFTVLDHTPGLGEWIEKNFEIPGLNWLEGDWKENVYKNAPYDLVIWDIDFEHPTEEVIKKILAPEGKIIFYPYWKDKPHWDGPIAKKYYLG